MSDFNSLADLKEEVYKNAPGSNTKTQIGNIVDEVFTSITKLLANKKGPGKVRVTGFGTFAKKKRAARDGRNPSTGEAVKIAASNAVSFSAGAELKRAVN